jgi:hypothetical protein
MKQHRRQVDSSDDCWLNHPGEEQIVNRFPFYRVIHSHRSESFHDKDHLKGNLLVPHLFYAF